MANGETAGNVEENAFQAFDFVYAGRISTTPKKVYAQIHCLLDGQLGPRQLYDPKALKKLAIGGVYRGVTFCDGTARGLEKARFVGRWSESEAMLMDWRARDDAVESAQRLAKLEADTRKHSELEALLLPVRKLYAAYTRKYDKAGLEALEQAVLRALRAPPRKTEVGKG